MTEQESVCGTVEQILTNRERRFLFLTKKDRIDDAIAVADEFYEWFAPEHEDDEDLITYFRLDELQQLLKEKVQERRKRK